MRSWLAFVVGGIVAGCGPAVSTPEGQDTDGSGSGDDSGMVTGVGPATTVTSSSTSGAATSSESSGQSTNTTGTGGWGEGEACDYILQDCPEGLKCVRIDLDGDYEDERICVPVVADPQPVGAACEVDMQTGKDDCSSNSFCAPVFSPDGTGICTEFCAPIHNAFECEDPDKMCTGSSSQGEYGCFPLCDPLADPCPQGQACFRSYPDQSGFVCYPSSPTHTATSGDPCYATTPGCDPGSLCYQCAPGHECLMNQLDYGPGCDPDNSAGCCTEFCDLQSGECSSPFHECVPYFGEPSEDYPNLGLCRLPEDFDWCDGAVEDPPLGQCRPEDAEPNYPWCSVFDTSACEGDNLNLSGGACGYCWCFDACDSVDECAIPETGTAQVVCDPDVGCSLLCDEDSDCPNEMNCRFYSGELRCLWRPDDC